MYTASLGVFSKYDHCDMLGRIYSRKAIGFALKSIRRDRGLASFDFASEAGIHPSYYSTVENGRNYISVQKLSQLCQVLDLKLSDFFLLIENMGALEELTL